MKAVDFIRVGAVYGRGLVLRDIPLAALSNFWLLFVLSCIFFIVPAIYFEAQSGWWTRGTSERGGPWGQSRGVVHRDGL